jgi:hypothetical protein
MIMLYNCSFHGFICFNDLILHYLKETPTFCGAREIKRSWPQAVYLSAKDVSELLNHHHLLYLPTNQELPKSYRIPS